MQGPDLLIRPLPPRLALRRALLGQERRLWGWHGHGDGPIGQQHGLLAPRGVDRVERLAMRGASLVERFGEVLQYMQAVRDLRRCRGSLVGTMGIGLRAIAGDARDARMLLEPLGQRLGTAIGEEPDRLAALQIDQHGAIGLAVP
jgi:hypothetical protein